MCNGHQGQIPLNPDIALTATLHLTNAPDAAAHLEAERRIDELRNSFPALTSAAPNAFGLLPPSGGDASSACDDTRTDADTDASGLAQHSCYLSCGFGATPTAPTASPPTAPPAGRSTTPPHADVITVDVGTCPTYDPACCTFAPGR